MKEQTRDQPKRPTETHAQTLVKLYCERADVREAEFWAGRRFKSVCWVRWKVCQELREEGYSLPGIGQVLGLDHSSVHHACRKGDLGPPPPISGTRNARVVLGWRAAQVRRSAATLEA
jgi:chromosomal replication initiation ATPase DnaA